MTEYSMKENEVKICIIGMHSVAEPYILYCD